jgi:glycosyltransferase involved in cell wall biosynthesis
MRTLFVSDLEALGGAGIAASRLAIGLAAEGVEVTRFYNNSDKVRFAEAVTWRSRYVGPPRTLAVGLNGLRRLLPSGAQALARLDSTRRLVQAARRESFDVLHIHSLHASAWNHDSVAALDPGLPTVWTFHDCWSFAPQSQIFRDFDGKEVRVKPDGDPRLAMARRLRYFGSRKRLRLAANSNFTAAKARAALGLPVAVVPYGIDLGVFAPIDKAAARAALRLPPDAFVVGFIADNRNEPLKGFVVLRRALERLAAPVQALAIGTGSAGEEQIGKARVRLFGHVASPPLLAILYSAADVFVVPSLIEGLGMVGMESVACGTPVIGSDAGGIPDVVQQGRTGWLFPPGDDAALAARLSALQQERGLALALAASCRAHAAEQWGLERQARRYLALYQEVCR